MVERKLASCGVLLLRVVTSRAFLAGPRAERCPDRSAVVAHRGPPASPSVRIAGSSCDAPAQPRAGSARGPLAHRAGPDTKSKRAPALGGEIHTLLIEDAIMKDIDHRLRAHHSWTCARRWDASVPRTAARGRSTGRLPPPKQPPNIVTLTPVEQLGKDMLYDNTLSNPPGYACPPATSPRRASRDPARLSMRFGASARGRPGPV